MTERQQAIKRAAIVAYCSLAGVVVAVGLLTSITLAAIFPSTGNLPGHGGSVNIVNYGSSQAAIPSPTPSPTPMDHVADANARLSILGISPGYQVIQDDNSTTYQYNGDAEAVQIIGAGTLAANGYYTKRGTLNGRGAFTLIGHPTLNPITLFDGYGVVWNGTQWWITDSGGSRLYTSDDDVANPWDVTTWTEFSGDAPAPTAQHIASKNALLTCAFVSGAGTTAANGIYTERPALGLVDGKSVYNLLGQTDDLANYSISFDGVNWNLNDSGGVGLYLKIGGANPWSGSWVEVTGDSPAPTVASVTQGELDAGVLVTGAVSVPLANDVYLINGVFERRNSYTGITNVLVLQDPPKDPRWQIDGASPRSEIGDNPAFPWEATFNDGATVTRNDIATETNWLPLP